MSSFVESFVLKNVNLTESMSSYLKMYLDNKFGQPEKFGINF